MELRVFLGLLHRYYPILHIKCTIQAQNWRKSNDCNIRMNVLSKMALLWFLYKWEPF